MDRPATADGAISNFLRVNYDELYERVLAADIDEEILEWCHENGRRLNDGDLIIWNDFATPTLQRLKNQLGLTDRSDIATFGDLFDFEEGRRS